jgi:hypothetical protein
MKVSQKLADLGHPRFQQLAECVHAAIPIAGGAPIGSAGIDDLAA